ncbi:MAG: hypothetical protein QOK24_1418 [Verrucomicrobiota bacterium]
MCRKPRRISACRLDFARNDRKSNAMRSMTGYGRGEVDHAGAKFSVELNSVNRKQSDIVVNLPRDLVELEPRIRQTINEKVSRGRTNVFVALHDGASGIHNLALDTALARSYHEAMLTLQKELSAPGEITIGTILQAPGVMRSPEHSIDAEKAWPVLQKALALALADLIKMREREGKHLAKDLIHRLKVLRAEIKQVRALYPEVVKKYRNTLFERIEKAGVNLPLDDERLLKEIAIFADRADISEELTRLESHLAQFAHHLRKNEPVGRTLEFITQEIFRELNTLGAKSNDAAISQRVVACKAELEKIREQIQNLE